MKYYVVCSPNGLESKIKAVDDKMAKTIATQRFCSQIMSDLILYRGEHQLTRYITKQERLKNKLNPKERFHVCHYKKGEIVGIKKYKHDISLPRMERWSAWKKA